MIKKVISQDKNQINRAKKLLLTQPIVTDLSVLFSNSGYKLYIVGGSVRDALLDKVHDDFDFATDAPPEKVVELVKKYADQLWTVGIKYGTVGIEKYGVKAEITTFRGDVYTSESRRPEVIFESEIETDLSRRDFTVNSMAFSLPEGEFIDAFGGLGDLAARTLRTPISPEVSFSDDPLRMLRALRFVSTLIMIPGEEVLDSVKKMRSRLQIVSPERIQAEFSKLMTGLAPSQGIYYLVATGLTDEFIPEITELATCVDPEHRHKDLLEHTLNVIDGVPSDLPLRLAALFHDIGKPKTKSFEPDGVHFYHHEVVGAKMAAKRLAELRYPNSMIDEVTSLIEMHMRFHTYRLGWADKAVRRYVRDCGPHLKKINILVRADCTTRNPFQSRKFANLLDELDLRIERLEKEEESAKIRPPINGNELMDHLNIEPGPLVGKIMTALLEARLDEEVMTKEEAYEYVDKWVKNNQNLFEKNN